MKKIIIDTDGGVDDAIALLISLASSTYCGLDEENPNFCNLFDILAVTTVAGNVPVDLATENVWRVFEQMFKAKCNFDIKRKQKIGSTNQVTEAQIAETNLRTLPPIYKGCDKPLVKEYVNATAVHGDDGLGGITLLKDETTGMFLYPSPTAFRDNYQQYMMKNREEIDLLEKEGKNNSKSAKNQTLHLECHAVDAILHLVAQYPHEITIITLGPLTNIAKAIQKDKETMLKLKELVIMGGAFEHYGNVTLSAEYNIWVDPDSVSIALQLGESRPDVDSDKITKIVFVPLDVTHQVFMTEAILSKHTHTSQLAPFIGHVSNSLLELYAYRYNSEPKMAMHDPLAVVAAMPQQHITVIPEDSTHRTHAYVAIELQGQLTIGQTIADLRTWRRRDTSKFNAYVCVAVNAEHFWQLFEGRTLQF